MVHTSVMETHPLFHEWEFRTRLKSHKEDEEKHAEAMSKAIDGLRGDAFVVVQEVGFHRLWQTGSTMTNLDDSGSTIILPGADLLGFAMEVSVFALTTHEAKELFRQSCKPSGSLSRQSGESMHQYVSIRRRCWKLLKELDNEIEVSEGHRSDMLLDLAGLDRIDRITIQVSIGIARDFEKIADALIVKHPRIRLREKPGRRPSSSPRKGKCVRGRKGYKGTVRGKTKDKGDGSYVRYASLADEKYAQYDGNEKGYVYVGYEVDPDNPEAYTDPAHWSEDDDAQEATSQEEDEEEEEWQDDGFEAYVSNSRGATLSKTQLSNTRWVASHAHMICLATTCSTILECVPISYRIV